MSIELAKWIPWLPAIGALLCGVCCTGKSIRRLAAPICVAAIFIPFLITLLVAGSVDPHHPTDGLALYTWIAAAGLDVGFNYHFDNLTLVMLCVVTGVGTLVAVYASGYMAGDRGYARFFAAVCLFIFAMTTLVMADNLVLLYLGWEGVGLCSYLLIGFYYDKPPAVAAAKKAFIVNRIGDLGFALGIFLTYREFNTVQYTELIGYLASDHADRADMTVAAYIPFLLMLGAFGKSAQIPLYVWLPDAMEGPTPVSALIHAATMVTAGVYMIARLLPVFELSPYALPTVATIGALTAFFAATIALRQYDIKRVFAYSTISQLGYMFLGIGAASSVGAVFHLFTHAFFKALLFLTAGSVMHALAGQLDMRKMSGLRTKMPVTCGLMLVGCLALAGFPFTSGFYSKDTILAAAMGKGMQDHSTLFVALALLGLLTALITAFYTFRLWFRVFMGPTHYEFGQEHHHDDAHEAHPTDDPAAPDITVEHHHEPHEMPWLMNGPLFILAAGSVIAGVWIEHTHWMQSMIDGSTAAAATPHDNAHHAYPTLFGTDLHTAMMRISAAIAVTGILAAAYYHWLNRNAAERVAQRWPALCNLLTDKYRVDEMYQWAIVQPLRGLGYAFFIADRLIIDGLVTLAGTVPRLLGIAVRPTQSGKLQGYGLGMAAGAAVIAVMLIVLL